MAKKIFFAIIAMVAVLFTGCEKDMLVENSNQYSSDAGKRIEPVTPEEEKIVNIIDKDKTERFVNGGVEYSFIPVLIDQDGGEHPLTRMSTVWPFTAKGTDPQIFDGIKTHEYTTISGEFRSSSSEDPGGVWTARIRKSTQPYTAQNKSESHSFNHQVEAEVAEMVCTYEYEGLKREFVFPAPEIVISGKQLPNQKAANVPYNGKVFEADQYTWPWNVTATIAKEYRVDGEKYTEPREGENIAYFLLHEIDTDLDKSKTNYIVNINSGERTLYQDPQTVHFELVTTDNGVETDRKAYDFEEVFNIVARGGYNKTLASEEALKTLKIESFNKGEIKSTNSTKDICSLKTFNFGDVITISDGNVINVEGIFEALSWNGNEFPYASTTSARTAVLSSVKNTALSTVSHAVYDVTLILTYPIVYNNSNKVGESKTIVIKWQDDAVIPDDIVTREENMQYVIVTKVSDSKDELIATEQFNAWNTNTYNRGVLQSSEAHKVDLPLSVKTANGSSVSIKKEQRGQKVSVRAIDEGTASTTDSKVEGEDYTVRMTTRTVTYTMSDGGKLSVTLVYGRSRKDGKDVLAYTEAKNLRVMSVETPVKNEALSSGENEVYNVKVNFAVDLEEKGSVQTRAAGDVGTEYLVANYQQTIGDEYIPGTERTVITVTPKDGDKLEWLVEGFMERTLLGEVRVDYKNGVYSPSLIGVDGTSQEVSNHYFEQKGSGYKGTGNGTYSQPATNGKENLTSQFLRNVGGDVVTTLNFPSGPKTVTIPATFEIRDLSPEITPTGSSNGFDTYRYTARVEGISTLYDKSITLSATANTQLKVKKSNNLVRQWNEPSIRPNGQGFDLTVVFYEEYEQDGVITKTLTDKMGRGFDPQHTDDLTVSAFANPETTSNGATGGTRGTYSSTTRVGNGSRNNVRSYWYDDVKTISYNGQSVTFRGSATFDEVSSTVGSPSVQGKNNVRPFTNKAKMVYTVRCDNKSESETITNEVKWNIIVPIPDNVPDLVPGKIKSAAITCVPANGDNASNYADGSNKRNAIKTICIVTDEGAVAVPFAAWNNDNVVVPTNNEITNGNFVSGNYSTAYNSGYYKSGKWVPAIAKDNSWGISYSIPSQENIRSIRNETLKQWNWRDGNYSVFVDGYTFDVDANGVLTVRYKGEVVLQCK